MSKSRFNTPVCNVTHALKSKWCWLVAVVMMSTISNAQLRGYNWTFSDASNTTFKSVPAVTGYTDTLELEKIGGGSFSTPVSDNVGLGTGSTGPIMVRPFIKSVGLEFLNSVPRLITSTYTIEMVINLSGDDDNEHRRLIGFTDLSDSVGNNGIYISGAGTIDFYNGTSHLVTGSPLAVNTWYHLVFTRNASNVISYYRNGVLIGTYTDSPNDFIPNAGGYYIVSFLKDDVGEETSGKLARIGMYNEALSLAAIEESFNNIGSTGVLADAWKTTGNSGTTASNFIGTKDNQPLIFKTNNAEALRVTTSGNVGIGTNNPLYKLDVNGTLRVGNLSADPSGAAGVIYYNSASNKYRGNLNGAWKNFLMEGDTVISSLNGLKGKTQFFVTGTSGNNFNIYSTDSTHTFNIPDASDTSRGFVSMGTQTFAGLKSFSALASGGIAPPTTGLTKMVITDANGRLSFATTPAGGDAYLNGTQTFAGSNTFSNNINKFTGLSLTDTTQYLVSIKADGTLVRSTKFATIDIDPVKFSTYTGTLSAGNITNSNFIGYRAGYLATSASNSSFLGREAGYAATNASHSVFIGKSAGYLAPNARNAIFLGESAGFEDAGGPQFDSNNGTNDYSILIGRFTGTNGFKNSILLGGSNSTGSFVVNTADNQFMLAPNISKLRFKDFDYDLAVDTLATRAFARTMSVNAANVTGIVAIANGGTGSSTKNFVDLSTAQTVNGVKTFASVVTSALATNGTGNNANLFIPNGNSAGSGTNIAQLLVEGSSNILYRISKRGNINPLIPAGYAYGSEIMGTMDITEGASGAHPLIAGHIIKPVNITNGAANTTNTASLYIEGPATGITPTDQSSSLWIASGNTRLGKAGTATGTLSFEGATSGRVMIQPASAAGSWTLTLPTAYPAANGYVLSANTNGTSSWIAPSGPSINVDTSSSSLSAYTGSIGAISRTGSNFFGHQAGLGASAANYSNFFGLKAGRNATNVEYSNFLGFYAGDGATNASYSNFLGMYAGQNGTWAQHSNFIGYEAGRNSNASRSSFIGRAAGSSATSAAYSVFIGDLAGFGAAQARNSIFIGEDAGTSDNINNGPSDYSVLIGRYIRTGGKKNSILLGGSTTTPNDAQVPTYISNTQDNQFMLAPNINKLRFNSFDYDLATDTLATRAYARTLAGSAPIPTLQQVLTSGTALSGNFTISSGIIDEWRHTAGSFGFTSYQGGSTRGYLNLSSNTFQIGIGSSGTVTRGLVFPTSDLTLKNVEGGIILDALSGNNKILNLPNSTMVNVLYYDSTNGKLSYGAAPVESGFGIDSTKWGTDSINLYNKNIGNIGVGTINPTAKLHALGSLRFESYKNNAEGDSVLSTDIDGNLKLVALPQDNGSGFGVDSTKWSADSINIFNKNTGNVGIGTIIPTAKFHTVGSLRFESFKNNEQGDSVLTTDADGNLKLIYMPYGSTGGGDSTGGVSYTFENGVAQSNGHVSIGGSLLDSVKLNLNGKPFNFNSGSNRIFSFTPNGTFNNSRANYDLTANSTKFNIGANQDSAGYGGQLSFNGFGNTDALWMSRFNAANDASEIRMNLGDEGGSGDKFHIGYQSGASWNSNFVVQANGQAGIGTSELSGDLSVGKQHGEKLSIGNNGWANKTIIATGINGQSDYTEIKVPGAQPNSAYLRINNEGSVGIGTTLTDAGYKLLVNGRIKAVGLRVKAYTNWPDYVFDSAYQLKPLAEVEKFIKTNKHLPEVPTADEVDKEGHDVSEIQIKLLQKIEELTLYIIEQDKRVKDLEDKNKKLDDQNKQILQLQQQLDELKKLILKKD